MGCPHTPWTGSIQLPQHSCPAALLCPPPVAVSMQNNGLLPEWPDFSTLCLPEYTSGAADKSRPVTLPWEKGYPCIVLYDLAYPHHLQEIYPFEHGGQARM